MGLTNPGAQALPFDWRHRSGAKTYVLPDGATNGDIAAERKRFAKVLKACIQPILLAQAPAKPEQREVVWQPTSASAPAVWRSADAGLQFRNGSMEGGRREVLLAAGTRAIRAAHSSGSGWARIRSTIGRWFADSDASSVASHCTRAAFSLSG